jgi:hypothetical protein
MSEIKQELERLAVNGLLKPAEVVNAARSEESPLHHCFCWDDNEAAEKWREEQARQLIRSVRIEVNVGKPVSIRAYVSLPVDRESGAGYRHINDVMGNEFMRRQLSEEINSKVKQWEERANLLGVLVDFSETREQARKVA